jgi:hypothetical protein
MASDRLSLYEESTTRSSADTSLQLAPLQRQANLRFLPRLPRPLEPRPSRESLNLYKIKSIGAKHDGRHGQQVEASKKRQKHGVRSGAVSPGKASFELPPIENIDTPTAASAYSNNPNPSQHSQYLTQPSFRETLGPQRLSADDRNGSQYTQDANEPKEKKKKRNKWTQEETEHLLKGVQMYGIGNWKAILNHEGFAFTERNATDLKDRFRTLRPGDYGTSKTNGNETGIRQSSVTPERNGSVPESPTNGKKPRKPLPTHRKTAEDLARLGIEEPFRKSARRERRGFTDEEDTNLLRGYESYGASWSRIRADQSLDLSHRRATDLRDRFRNRFPDKYAGSGLKAKPGKKDNDLAEPDSAKLSQDEFYMEDAEGENDDMDRYMIGSSSKPEQMMGLSHSLSISLPQINDYNMITQLSSNLPSLNLDSSSSIGATVSANNDQELHRLLLDESPTFSNTSFPRPIVPSSRISKAQDAQIRPISTEAWNMAVPGATYIPNQTPLSSWTGSVHPLLPSPYSAAGYITQAPGSTTMGTAIATDWTNKTSSSSSYPAYPTSSVPSLQPIKANNNSIPSANTSNFVTNPMSSLPSLPAMISSGNNTNAEPFIHPSGNPYAAPYVSVPPIMSTTWDEIGATYIFDLDEDGDKAL